MSRFDQINPHIVFVLVAVVLIIPMLKPLGLPIAIDDQLTMPVYNWIEGLSPGDIVVFDIAYSGSSGAECTPQLKAFFSHCMMKGVKAVGVAQWEPGSTIAWTELHALADQLMSEGISAEYGVDWAFPGFKAGGATTWRSMQDDMWTACGNVDYGGNALSDLPLMSRLKKWGTDNTKGIMIFSAGSPGIPTYTTYFPTYPLYVGDVAVQVAGTSNLLRSGQVRGILPGLGGAAQYEKLINRFTATTKRMDAQSLGHIAIILLVILGNIGYQVKMRNTPGQRP